MSDAADSTMEQDNNRRSGKEIFADYFTQAEMADARGVLKQALSDERRRGEGPPWVKVGKLILYRKSAFYAWLREIEH